MAPLASAPSAYRDSSHSVLRGRKAAPDQSLTRAVRLGAADSPCTHPNPGDVCRLAVAIALKLAIIRRGRFRPGA